MLLSAGEGNALPLSPEEDTMQIANVSGQQVDVVLDMLATAAEDMRQSARIVERAARIVASGVTGEADLSILTEESERLRDRTENYRTIQKFALFLDADIMYPSSERYDRIVAGEVEPEADLSDQALTDLRQVLTGE